MNHMPSNFPKLFDTHTHLSDKKFDSDRKEVLQRCDEWLEGWINVGSDLDSTKKVSLLQMNFQKVLHLVNSSS